MSTLVPALALLTQSADTGDPPSFLSGLGLGILIALLFIALHLWRRMR
jgi:hypothetical protein